MDGALRLLRTATPSTHRRCRHPTSMPSAGALRQRVVNHEGAVPAPNPPPEPSKSWRRRPRKRTPPLGQLATSAVSEEGGHADPGTARVMDRRSKPAGSASQCTSGWEGGWTAGAVSAVSASPPTSGWANRCLPEGADASPAPTPTAGERCCRGTRRTRGTRPREYPGHQHDDASRTRCVTSALTASPLGTRSPPAACLCGVCAAVDSDTSPETARGPGRRRTPGMTDACPLSSASSGCGGPTAQPRRRARRMVAPSPQTARRGMTPML